MTRLNLVGQVFTRLTVIEKLAGVPGRGTQYRCICECGEETLAFTGALQRGNKKSCGCLNRELLIARNTKHGYRYHPLFETYRKMVSRCYNENHHSYPYYGGKGIIVCDEWLNNSGFLAFVADMGERPEGMTLDRIDGDLGYSPENCRWATKELQNFNRKPFKEKRTGIYEVKNRLGVKTGRWGALIRNNGKVVYLGVFDTEDEAIAKRVEAELEVYGQTKPV